jgi:two-component system, NtrC family, response regulator AtoC
LFGHEKGAFTGAMNQKQGQFELADGGTLFLDEIGDMPLTAQTRLLRALQEREIRRVGGTRWIQIDVRIIAATHQDVEKRLRQDLRYRLNVFPIPTPALRERRSDIPILARHFASMQDANISAEAEALLVRHSWPGNVRELQNVIQRAVALGSGDTIVPENLPLEIAPAPQEAQSMVERSLNYVETLDAAKRELLETAYARANGNLTRVADLLGVTPAYVYMLINKLDMPHLRKRPSISAVHSN